MQTWQAIHKLASILETMQENSLNHKKWNALGALATGDSVIDTLSEYAEQIGFEVIQRSGGFDVKIYGFTCGGIDIQSAYVDGSYIRKYLVFRIIRINGKREEEGLYKKTDVSDLKQWLSEIRKRQEQYKT